jgi:hypothetical protein
MNARLPLSHIVFTRFEGVVKGDGVILHEDVLMRGFSVYRMPSRAIRPLCHQQAYVQNDTEPSVSVSM